MCKFKLLHLLIIVIFFTACDGPALVQPEEQVETTPTSEAIATVEVTVTPEVRCGKYGIASGDADGRCQSYTPTRLNYCQGN